MTPKEELLAFAEKLPADVSWAQVSEALRLIPAFEEAEREIDAGHFHTQAEVEAHLDECLRKFTGRAAA